jgi:N-sulfoglucosamine sulfohydrolase
MRTASIQTSLAALGVLLLTGGDLSIALAEKPNVLLITADDLGNQLSCYGDDHLQTPRLDALAAEGVRFTRAYVTQSSCSSSRASLLTGLYPHQNGQYGLAHLGFSMHAGQTNLPALLKAAGYRTGIIGKLHVEPAAEFPFDWEPKGKGTAAGPTRDVRWVADQSREFFTSVKDSKEPFFYYVNYFDPHGPYRPDVRQVAGLPEKPLDPEHVAPLPLKAPRLDAQKRITALIYDCIARVDVGTGMLLDELEAAGLAENTLVLFLGDNGAPVLHGKCSCYEPGVQVPLLVRWPGRAKPGQVRDELVSAVDVLPTILEATGIALPQGLAGRPLQPLLRPDQAPSWRKHLFTEMNFHTANMYLPQRTVRDGQFKLLLNLAPAAGQTALELYDLQADPEESNNLAEEPAFADRRQRLESALGQWREETRDPLLDAARLKRWNEVAARWKASAPRLDRGPYPDVARVPPGELELLK